MAKKHPKYDPTLPFTPVEIDGETYKLCYDFGAIGTIEGELEAAGHPDVNLLVMGWQINARTLPVLLAAGLRVYHPEISFDDAKKLVNWRNAMALTVAIRKAQGQFSGDADSDGEDAGKHKADPPEAPVPLS